VTKRGAEVEKFKKRCIMLCPPTFFSLGFVFGEVAKIKVTLITFHVRCIAKSS